MVPPINPLKGTLIPVVPPSDPVKQTLIRYSFSTEPLKEPLSLWYPFKRTLISRDSYTGTPIPMVHLSIPLKEPLSLWSPLSILQTNPVYPTDSPQIPFKGALIPAVPLSIPSKEPLSPWSPHRSTPYPCGPPYRSLQTNPYILQDPIKGTFIPLAPPIKGTLIPVVPPPPPLSIRLKALNPKPHQPYPL